MATTKKAVTFRYHPDLEKDLQIISEVADYSNTKNKGITLAVKFTAAYVRDLMRMKKIEDKRDVRNHILNKYQISSCEL